MAELGAELGSSGSIAQLSITPISCFQLKKERKAQFHPFPCELTCLPALLLPHASYSFFRVQAQLLLQEGFPDSSGCQDPVLFALGS